MTPTAPVPVRLLEWLRVLVEGAESEWVQIRGKEGRRICLPRTFTEADQALLLVELDAAIREARR